ncbi:hypothetical protein FQR65_LT20627 [Abscondita terminalis]|nr:hypothetical protein FQR65_LT20627 [Abscondita terminalis]
MQLTLVRHGEAAPAINGVDSKRPLTERGHLQAEQTAQFLKETVQPDAYFPEVSVLICDKIKPEDDAKLAIEWLSQLPFERIVVVCHMNVVGHIAEQLTHEHFNPFALAEARIYEQTVIANGLSTQNKAFIPTV